MRLFIFILCILGPGLTYGQTGFPLRELHEENNPRIKELAGSVAAMVSKDKLVTTEAYFSPRYEALQDRGYCPDFAYAQQTSLSECSGTLISDRHILTAGHCADIKDMCKKFSWVFGYELDDQKNLPTRFKRHQVYNCKKIIEKINVNPRFGLIGRIYETFLRTDIAIIELSRPVRNRKPVVLSSREIAPEGEQVFSISYPLGMPAKIHYDGQIQGGLNNPSYFWSSLIVFAGSSGGPIFEEETGHLIGVISKGISRTMRDKERKCLYEKRPDSDSSDGQTNSNAQMKKILEVIKAKKIPVTLN